MRNTLRTGLACLFALALSLPAFASDRIIGNTTAARVASEIIPVDPVSGAPGRIATGGGQVAAGSTSGGTPTTLCVDAVGVLCAPYQAAAGRVITKTAVSATTSTTICPAVSNPTAVEIQVQSGGIGLGLQGQALTSATYGTTTADPDIVIGTAGTLYTFPVAPSNLITAYGAAQIVTCIQTRRQ